jgi:uncharacterized membrane protein
MPLAGVSIISMRLAAPAVVLGAILWTTALFLAPSARASSPRFSGFSAAVYAAGAVVCHQRPERSFFVSGQPLPVCARCTGLYVSAVIGGLLTLAIGGAPPAPRRARWTLALASVPTAVTWTGEFAGLIHPANLTRAIAAIPLGIVAAWLVIHQLTTPRYPLPATRSPLPASRERHGKS